MAFGVDPFQDAEFDHGRVIVNGEVQLCMLHCLCKPLACYCAQTHATSPTLMQVVGRIRDDGAVVDETTSAVVGRLSGPC